MSATDHQTESRTLLTRAEQETASLAVALAPCLRITDRVGLAGPLGAGKSVFARALIRTLTGEPALDVPSPTYTLVERYDAGIGPIYHFDAYRLETPSEIWEAGLEDALETGITLIEWVDRVRSLVPTETVSITILPQSQTGEGARRIVASASHDWWQRHPALRNAFPAQPESA